MIVLIYLASIMGLFTGVCIASIVSMVGGITMDMVSGAYIVIRHSRRGLYIRYYGDYKSCLF
jgi:hypothetical protein